MSVNISQQGIASASNFAEIPINPYDTTTYTEPDGSTWIRIIHHNNPAGGLFASTDNFNDYVYKDANRWFFASLCNCVTNGMWEFMVKQKQTSSSTEEKYRWIQYKNPYDAVYADVTAAKVTKNTSSGYNTNSVHGGIYKFNSSNTFFVTANASNGNWYGAFGSWAAYQNGIPGFPNTTVTSGYMDLYLRVSPNSSIYEDSIQSRDFIEW